MTFTVTHSNEQFFKLMERFSGSPAGLGGLVALKSSGDPPNVVPEGTVNLAFVGQYC